MSTAPELPIAIIGAGPVGLAAAAHLIARGLKPLVLERGASVGAAMLEWSHVRVFSPWRYNIDTAAGALLDRSGWQAPDQEVLPTGGEIVSQYLQPLAALPEIADNLILGATVTAIARDGHDKVSSMNRDKAPFVIHYTDAAGAEHQVRAQAVIDASGTWTQPNPLGVNGLPVPGEKNNDRIAYGIPDVTDKDRADYVGKRVLVVGSGHSAINVALA
nr:NAD(P)-binding domain-containing protein [Mesorhizobium amorphae]